MLLSMQKEDLLNYLVGQLNTFFPDKNVVRREEIGKYFDLILQKVEYCFSKIKQNRYFSDKEGNPYFDHLNGDQYAMFLYFVSNTLFCNSVDTSICSKVYLLNKYLNCIDVFYEVKLPDIFFFGHPLGTILGRANYSNYLYVCQGCTVGNNKGIYPILKEHVILRPNSSILGNCLVEENCEIASNSLLLDKNLEEDSLYIGNPKNYSIKKREKNYSFWG